MTSRPTEKILIKAVCTVYIYISCGNVVDYPSMLVKYCFVCNIQSLILQTNMVPQNKHLNS